MSKSLEKLNVQLEKVIRLGQAAALLDWDQQTYMPVGGVEARAEQLAVLSELAHQLFTSLETKELLAAAERQLTDKNLETDEAGLLRVVRHDYDLEAKLPSDLVRGLSRQTSLAHEHWVRAREASDFSLFAPALEKIVEMSRQKAEVLGYDGHIYDALLNIYEPGATEAKIRALFDELKPQLLALVKTIKNQPKVDAAILERHYPEVAQQELILQVLKAIGFDFNRGRQDESAHPFCTNFGHSDVRLTTRFDERYLPMALYGSLHEMGHGLYEQGSPARFEGTFLAGGTSLGVHESQSRLWENLVGRSRSFSAWLFPQLQKAFPEALAGVSVEDYYQAINKVSPSTIRVEADEVTYNLHIMLRFELECDLLTGKLAVADLPEAWKAKMQEYLGITPANDAEGVLQDVHWSMGSIGYFPTYTLGNLLAAQLWHRISIDIPTIEDELAQGQFSPLIDWLGEHVHQYGRKYWPEELILKATGEPLSSKYYLEYLKEKYIAS